MRRSGTSSSASRLAREKCGCASEPGGLRWVVFCSAHGSEFRELHEQAQRDYLKRRERRKGA